jgi:hypothetical protein
MNCERFDELASAFLDGELAEADLAACDTHLAQCAGCRFTMEDLKTVSLWLKGEDRAGTARGFEMSLATRLISSTPSKGHLRWLVACAASFLFGCGMVWGLFLPKGANQEGGRPIQLETNAGLPFPVERRALGESIWAHRPIPGNRGAEETFVIKRVRLADSVWSVPWRIREKKGEKR